MSTTFRHSDPKAVLLWMEQEEAYEFILKRTL